MSAMPVQTNRSLSEGFFSGFGTSGRTVPTLLMKSRSDANGWGLLLDQYLSARRLYFSLSFLREGSDLHFVCPSDAPRAKELADPHGSQVQGLGPPGEAVELAHVDPPVRADVPRGPERVPAEVVRVVEDQP